SQPAARTGLCFYPIAAADFNSQGIGRGLDAPCSRPPRRSDTPVHASFMPEETSAKNRRYEAPSSGAGRDAARSGFRSGGIAS
ncbi:MAG TPA: hypothetical protein VLT88_15640, partial [Desulfosarcina sp.]|nr:hypothetical protein [Desulfosarcina sp.]